MGIRDRNLHQFAQALRPWIEREKRFCVSGSSTVTSLDGSSANATIHNISAGGARITTDLPLRRGDRLTFVAEPFGLVEATVRWTDSPDAGVRIIQRDPFFSDYSFSYPP